MGKDRSRDLDALRRELEQRRNAIANEAQARDEFFPAESASRRLRNEIAGIAYRVEAIRSKSLSSHVQEQADSSVRKLEAQRKLLQDELAIWQAHLEAIEVHALTEGFSLRYPIEEPPQPPLRNFYFDSSGKPIGVLWQSDPGIEVSSKSLKPWSDEELDSLTRQPKAILQEIVDGEQCSEGIVRSLEQSEERDAWLAALVLRLEFVRRLLADEPPQQKETSLPMALGESPAHQTPPPTIAIPAELESELTHASHPLLSNQKELNLSEFDPRRFGGKKGKEISLVVSYKKLGQRDLGVLAKILKRADIRYPKYGDPVSRLRKSPKGFRDRTCRLRKEAKDNGWYKVIPAGYCISYATGPTEKRLKESLSKVSKTSQS